MVTEPSVVEPLKLYYILLNGDENDRDEAMP